MYTLSWLSMAKSPSAPSVRCRAPPGEGSSLNDLPLEENQAGAGRPTVSAPVTYTAPFESTLIDGSPTAWRTPLPSAAPTGSEPESRTGLEYVGPLAADAPGSAAMLALTAVSTASTRASLRMRSASRIAMVQGRCFQARDGPNQPRQRR